jgi:hypothetical protein
LDEAVRRGWVKLEELNLRMPESRELYFGRAKKRLDELKRAYSRLVELIRQNYQLHDLELAPIGGCRMYQLAMRDLSDGLESRQIRKVASLL